MLVYSHAISFLEFPGEISLVLNISECPCRCENCSEPELREKIGKPISFAYIDELLDTYKNYELTCIGFMGGDAHLDEVKKYAEYIKEICDLKVGFYSGRDQIDLDLIPFLDYYKYGRWIMPKGDPSTWHLKPCGPIVFPWSNQRIYEIIDKKLIDITYKFREENLGDLKQYIIEEDNDNANDR